MALSVGCSCPLRHPQQHYCEADFVANVKVRRVVTLPDGQTVLRVRVRRLLKSTPKATAALSKRLIYTIPGTCSPNVTSRSMHVITGDIQAGKPWTSACHFAAPWSSLASKMKKGFRLLYQTGCDCPILSCHWWESRCPSAAFFCSWRTSTDTDDCQARHGVCLRKPEGGCGWLGGRMYRGCMKTWRQQRVSAPSGHNHRNIASLVPGGRTSYGVHVATVDHDTSDAITSNDVVDGVLGQGADGDVALVAGKRRPPLAAPGLGADTTYSFGPRVVATSRFHKPRKPGPRSSSPNSIYPSHRRKPIKLGSGGRLGFGGSESSRSVGNTVSLKGGAKTGRRVSDAITRTKPDSEDPLPLDTTASVESTASVLQSAEEGLIDLDSTNEADSEDEPSIELAGVYHRRRYPEYTTRIGYIPDN